MVAGDDGVEGALNINVVLRWEYLLGATLFVIYRRSQVPNLSLAPGQPGGSPSTMGPQA